jgi:hypothetical protein
VVNPHKYTVYTLDEPIYVGQGDARDGEGAGGAEIAAHNSQAAAAAAAAGAVTESRVARTSAAPAARMPGTRIVDEGWREDGSSSSRVAMEVGEVGQLEVLEQEGGGDKSMREPPPAFGSGIEFRPSGEAGRCRNGGNLGPGDQRRGTGSVFAEEYKVGAGGTFTQRSFPPHTHGERQVKPFLRSSVSLQRKIMQRLGGWDYIFVRLCMFGYRLSLYSNLQDVFLRYSCDVWQWCLHRLPGIRCSMTICMYMFSPYSDNKRWKSHAR